MVECVEQNRGVVLFRDTLFLVLGQQGSWLNGWWMMCMVNVRRKQVNLVLSRALTAYMGYQCTDDEGNHFHPRFIYRMDDLPLPSGTLVFGSQKTCWRQRVVGVIRDIHRQENTKRSKTRRGIEKSGAQRKRLSHEVRVWR